MDQKSIESDDMFQYVTLKIQEAFVLIMRDTLVKHVALILSFRQVFDQILLQQWKRLSGCSLLADIIRKFPTYM